MSQNSKKILVVDDDPDLLALTKKILSDQGYEIEVAYNGAQAKYKIENESFDLIISDLHMPFLNGIEFIKVIKFRSKKFASTPIIAISGHLSEELKTALSTAGITHVYRKPINYKELIGVIGKLLVHS